MLTKGKEGTGSLVILTGGSHRDREAVFRQMRERASSQGWLCLELEADALDRRAPYGAVQGVVELLRHNLKGKGKAEEEWASPLVALAGFVSRPTSKAAPEAGPTRAEKLFGPRTNALPRAEEIQAELGELVAAQARQAPLLVTLSPGEFVDASSRAFFGELGRQASQLPLVLVVSLSDEDREAHESWRRVVGPRVVRWESLEGGLPSGLRALRPEAERLPALSRRLLAAVAAAGPDASATWVAEALGMSAPQVADAAAPAEAAGLLVREKERFYLTEPGLQGEFLRLVPSQELRAVHAALGRILKASRPPPQGKMLYRLAEHWVESGLAEEAAPALLATGRESSRRGAHEESELELRRALVLAQSIHGHEGRELEGTILANLGISLEMQGSLTEAIPVFERAIRSIQGAGGGVERWGPILSRESRLVTEVGMLASDVDDRLLKAIPEAARRDLPSVESELHASLAHRLLMRGVREEGRKHAVVSVEMAKRGKDRAVLARALRMAALALSMGVAGGGEDKDARALLRELTDTIPPEEAGGEYAFALDDLATLECSEHHEPEAVVCGTRSVELARRICSRGDLLLMLGNFAEHQLHARDVEGSTRTLSEIKALADRYKLEDSHGVRQQWSLIEGLRLHLVGDLPAARRQMEATVALGEKVGARDIMGQALAYLVEFAVEAKDWEAARQCNRRLEREGLRRVLFTNYREMLDLAVAKIPPRPR